MATAAFRTGFVARAFRAGAFFAATFRLATVARLGPRATAFVTGLLRAPSLFGGAFLAGLRTVFDARGFDFMAYLF